MMLVRMRAVTAAAVVIAVVGLDSVGGAGAAVAAPAVSAVSAAAGPTSGGNRVTVAGSHFVAGAGVWFGRSRASHVRVVSAAKLVATAPSHVAGRVDLRVRTSAGMSPVSARDRYTFVSAPAISAVSPSDDALAGGHRITIVGKGLAAVTTVRFGTGVGRSLVHVSPTKLSVIDPAHPDGVVDVRAVSAGGTSPRTSGDRFSFVGQPRVTQVSPGAGPISRTAPVTISGHDFVHVTSVRFGTQVASGVAVVSPTTLRATPPSAAAGPVDVAVSTRYGTSDTTTADRYNYMNAPAAPTVTTTMAPAPSGFPSDATLSLTSSACDAVNSCYAVGQESTQVSEVGVIETLANNSWSASTAPVPADGVPYPVMELRSIRCPATGFCIAVGGYVNNNDYVRPLVETLSNGTWSAQALGVAQGTTDGYLSYLKCSSKTSCVATGPGQHGTTIAILDSTGWMIGLAPVPAGYDAVKFSPSDAACTTALCVVTGEYFDGTNLHGMADTWTPNSVKSAIVAPAPGGTVPVFLDSVDCAAPGTCVAVGRDRPAGVASGVAAGRPLTATLANGRWTSATAPLPADAVTPALNDLWSVSCAEATCVAVGDYAAANGTSGLVERIDGSTVIPAAVTPSAPDTSLMLRTVSCFAADSCRVGGTSNASNTPVVGTTGPGGTTLVTVPPATGAPSGTASLTQLDCSTDAYCSGVVDIRPASGPTQYELLTAG